MTVTKEQLVDEVQHRMDQVVEAGAEHEVTAREIVEKIYFEGCDWHGPIVKAHCMELHRERLEGCIASALTAAQARGAELQREADAKIVESFRGNLAFPLAVRTLIAAAIRAGKQQ